MKRKLLPLLIAGVTAVSANIAFAGAPTVYGKVNISLNKNDFESLVSGSSDQTTDNWNLNSNASRLGVKGDLDISTTLKAVYKLEYEVIPTADKEGDNGSDFKQRNTYAGLQGEWGTLIAGRNDSPLKLAQGEVDQFNDYYLGDIKNVLVGENRLNNIIMYSTPAFAGFGLTLGFAPGEGSGTGSGTNSATQHNKDDNGFADKTSIALSYKWNTLYLAAAHDENIETTDITRLVAQYGFGPVTLGALWQTAERNDSEFDIVQKIDNGESGDLNAFGGAAKFKKQDGWLVSAAWEITKEWVVKGQYAQSEATPILATLKDAEAKMWLLGVDWRLSKASTLFAYYSNIETEGDSTISSDSVADNTLGVGYELKF